MTPNQAIKLAIATHTYCPHCGDTNTLQTHHRKNRGMGGTPKRSLDRFDNLLRVCGYLNFAMESNSAIANDAKQKGWKLNSYDDFSKPYWDTQISTWVRLTQDGQKIIE
jgi:hypothetical protein